VRSDTEKIRFLKTENVTRKDFRKECLTNVSVFDVEVVLLVRIGRYEFFRTVLKIVKEPTRPPF
jgi:hypothetical protein